MDPTTEKEIFVAYSEISKAYRIYLPSQMEVVLRRDVKFEEDRAFSRSQELEEAEPIVSQQQQQLQQGSQGQCSRSQSSRSSGVSGSSRGT